jgi:transposase
LRTYLQEQRAWFRARLDEGMACGCAKMAAVCRELSRIEPALYTFARVEGVEPTNNTAERALRHAVQWRKTSYGTDGEAGSRFVERILSVAATCHQQGRRLLNFLVDCCRAAAAGRPAPSLAPQKGG